MAGEEEKAKGVDPERLDLSFGGGGSTSLDADRSGKGTVKENEDPGSGLDFDQDGGVERTGLDKLDADLGDEEGGEGDEPNTEETSEEKEAGSPEDLGDWNADDEEVGKKFDERYFTEKDGSQLLNMDALSVEVAANLAKEGGTAGLNAGTYGWLKDRLGVSKEYVDQIIAGQLAQREKNEEAFYSTVGGKDLYEAKLEWAKGVYTADQKARFNAAIKAGGDAAAEALELLNTRWEKAGNKAPEPKDGDLPKRPGIGVRRPSSPAKTVSSAENPARNRGVEPFSNADEHRKALREAQRSGDKAKIADVRKRLAASTFWR